MKWPFVPRSLFDETVADLRARLDASELDRRKLTRTIVKMKVAGGSIPRPVDGGQRLEQRPRDAFELAVDQNPHCRANPRLRRQQLEWARQQVEGGADRDEILGRLKGWHEIKVTDDDDDDEGDDLAEVGI